MEDQNLIVLQHGNTIRDIDEAILEGFKNKMKSQIFKLLPLREEKGEWEKHLEATIIELMGADDIFLTINFLRLISKLNALRFLDFKYYRKTIFECMNLIDALGKEESGV